MPSITGAGRTEEELAVAKLIICHLVTAMGGSFTISNSELIRIMNKVDLKITHSDLAGGMMIIKVEGKL